MKQESTRKYNHYLYDLILFLKTNAKKFSESLGYSRTDRVYNVLKGINNISVDLANDIVHHYPKVRYEWLITGKGEMLVDGQEKEITSDDEIIKNKPHDEQMFILLKKIQGLEEKIDIYQERESLYLKSIIAFLGIDQTQDNVPAENKKSRTN